MYDGWGDERRWFGNVEGGKEMLGGDVGVWVGCGNASGWTCV
jgi:hypothetical protein